MRVRESESERKRKRKRTRESMRAHEIVNGAKTPADNAVFRGASATNASQINI